MFPLILPSVNVASAAFTPASLSPRLWLRGSTGVFEDAGTDAAENGDAVVQWSDQSGGGRHLSQATVSQQPAYDTSTNAAGFLTFDGTDDVLIRSSSGAVSTATSGGVFCVYRPASVSSTRCIWSSADEASATRYIYMQTNSTTLQYVENNNGTETRIGCATALSINTTYVIGMVSDGSTISMYINSTTAQSLTVNAGSNAGDWFGDVADRDNFCVGSLKTSGGETRRLSGRIGDLFVIDGALTTQNINDSLGYLATTYGVTLS